MASDVDQARRPPTQAQVGEPYRHDQDARAAQGQFADAVERFRQGERASQEQATTDKPTQVAPRQPAGPSGHPGWLVALLAVLVALVAGLAVLAVRRSNRRTGIGQAT